MTWSIKPWLFIVSPSWKNLLSSSKAEIAILVTLGFRWLSWKPWPHYHHIKNDLVPYCQGPVQDGEATDIPSSPPTSEEGDERSWVQNSLHGSELFTVSTLSTSSLSILHQYQLQMFISQNTSMTVLYSVFLDSTIQLLTCPFENDAIELNSWAAFPAVLAKKFLNNKTSSVVI